jgi:Pyruvate/2-oxoacid:ferredoxin oxidoreductase delta subunit
VILLSIYSAVLIAVEALYFLWLRERSWERVILPRQQVSFSAICPSCMVGAPEIEVVEGSFSRTVGPTRKEFISMAIPYCKGCGTAINRDRKRAWNASVVLVVMILAGCWLW